MVFVRRIGFEPVWSPEIHSLGTRKDTNTGVDQRKKQPILAEKSVKVSSLRGAKYILFS